MKVKKTNSLEDDSNQQFKESFDADLKQLQKIVLQLENKIHNFNLSRSSLFEKDFCLASKIRDYEKGLIELALKVSGGSQVKALKLLGVKKSTLNSKIKRYKIQSNKLVY
ncbi:MAG: hypothetical protein K1X72_01195 [Pyrinomonadaceae bacterium]|nr:hypothetical protein [Pyrinomonadaceae bacterium]